MRRLIETAVILVGTLGWWGFVYPELSEVTETCIQEDAREETAETQGDTRKKHQGKDSGKAQEKSGTPLSLLEGLVNDLGGMGIQNGNICIKSRIAEYLYQGKEGYCSQVIEGACEQ